MDGWLEVIFEDVQGFIVDDAGFVAVSEPPSDTTSPKIEAPEAEKEIKEASLTAETIDMQVQASKNDIETLSAQERKMIAEFDVLSRKLDQTRRQVRNAGTGIAAIEEKIQQINQRSDDLQVSDSGTGGICRPAFGGPIQVELAGPGALFSLGRIFFRLHYPQKRS